MNIFFAAEAFEKRAALSPTAVGAIGGGLAGAAIGGLADDGRGALVGAGLGAATGAGAGHYATRTLRQVAQNISDASPKLRELRARSIAAEASEKHAGRVPVPGGRRAVAPGAVSMLPGAGSNLETRMTERKAAPALNAPAPLTPHETLAKHYGLAGADLSPGHFQAWVAKNDPKVHAAHVAGAALPAPTAMFPKPPKAAVPSAPAAGVPKAPAATPAAIAPDVPTTAPKPRMNPWGAAALGAGGLLAGEALLGDHHKAAGLAHAVILERAAVR